MRRSFILGCLFSTLISGGGPISPAIAGPITVPWVTIPETWALPLPDPFPIRRVLLPQDGSGNPLVETEEAFARMSVTAFESLVQRAARRAWQMPAEPQLVSATYQAHLHEGNLRGSAEWHVVQPGAGASWLPIDDLHIAIRDGQWSDGQRMLTRPTPDGGLELWVNGEGEQVLHLDWSARGIPEPGELRFNLGVPASAIASLTVDLPEGWAPSVSHADCLLYGPEGDSGDTRQWRVAFGGRTQLSLSIRGGPDEQEGSFQTVRAATTLELTSGLTRCKFDLTLEAHHGGIDAVTILTDPTLKVTDVVVNNREGWSVAAPNGDGDPQILTVRLREPSPGGKIVVYALAPLPNGPWSAPWLRVRDAIDQGETLLLQLHPDVQLNGWNAGDFRLVDVALADTDIQTLSLEGGFPSTTATSRQRPRAEIASVAPTFTVTQRTDWDITSSGSRLTTRLQCQPTVEALEQLECLLPLDWEVTSVTIGPDEASPRWQVRDQPARSLQIDLPQPVSVDETVLITVHLRQARTPEAGQVPFPDLTVYGAEHRNGLLTIRVSPAFEAFATGGGGVVLADLGLLEGVIAGGAAFTLPYPDPPADWAASYLHRGPLQGTLTLRLRGNRFQAELDSHLTVGTDRVVGRASLKLVPDQGAVNELWVTHTGPAPVVSRWTVTGGETQIADVSEIPLGAIPAFGQLLATTTPFGQLARTRIAQGYPNRWWRVRFLRPIERPVALTIEYESILTQEVLPVAAPLLGGGGIEVLADPFATKATPYDEQPVSLLVVVGSETLRGSVTLDLPSRLTPVTEGLLPESETPGRYRIDGNRYTLAFTATDRPSIPPHARIDSAQLTTWVPPHQAILCHYRCRLVGSGWTELFVRLPAGAEPLAVAVAGHWADVAGCLITETPQGVTCAVSVVAETPDQIVEVLYRLSAPSDGISMQLISPPPVLPVEPPLLHRIWNLPKGLVPFPASGWSQRIETVADPFSLGWEDTLGRYLSNDDPFRTPMSPLGEFAAPWPDPEHPQGVAFGVLLHRLGELAEAESPPLVVDRDALQEDGYHPDTIVSLSGPASPPFWSQLGLSLIYLRGQPVLTTPRYEALWRTARESKAIHEAVTRASSDGRDPTGRFRTVPDWLAAEASDSRTLTRDSSLLQGLNEALFAEWTAWEAWVDPSDPGVLPVLDSQRLRWAGWVITLIGVGLAGWLRPHAWSGKWWLLYGWVLGTGLGTLWLPPPLPEAIAPMFYGALLVAILAVIFRRRRAVPPSPRRGGRSTSVPRPKSGRVLRITTVLLLVALPASAQAPEPITVYFVPTTDDDTPPYEVLVPLELRERLVQIADATNSGSAAPLILDAVYEGSFVRETTIFEARYQVFCPVDGGELILPVAGIRLRTATLNGLDIYPQRGSDGENLVVRFPSPGDHALTLRYEASVIGTGSDREVRFSIPELPRSRLVFRIPSEFQQLDVVSWRGERIRRDDNTQQTLEADLGRTTQLNLRWRQPDRTDPTSEVQLTEMSFWDVRPLASRVHAVFDYRVTQGSLTSLQLAVPHELAVASVELRPYEPAPGNPLGTWLKAWRLEPGPTDESDQALTVELQAPLSGRFRLVLELLPRQPLVDTPTLRFPTASGMAQFDRFVAFATTDLAVQSLSVQGVSAYPTDRFGSSFQQMAPLPQGIGPFQHAYRVEPDETPVLQLALEAPAPSLVIQNDLTWYIGPDSTEGVFLTHWESDEDHPVSVLEWAVPPRTTVTEVSGLGIRNWSQTDTLIQVWLKEPVLAIDLRCRVTLSRTPEPGQVEEVLTLPPFQLPSGGQARSTLRIVPQAGCVLVPEQLEGLRATPDQKGGLPFVIESPNYQAKFRMLLPPPGGALEVYHRISAVEGRMTYQADVAARLDPDRPHHLTLHLRAPTPMAEALVELPDGGQVIPLPPRAEEQVWTINLPAKSNPEPYRLRISGSRPIDEAFPWDCPHVRATVGERVIIPSYEHLDLIGPEFSVEQTVGLESQPLPAQQSWIAVDPDWRLCVSVSPVRLRDTPLVVALGEIEAAQAAGRWVCRGTFILYQDHPVDLHWELPENGRLESVAIDGAFQDLSLGHAGRAWREFHLPETARWRTFQAVWELPSGVPDTPRMRVNGQLLPLGQILWTVYIPAEYQLEPVEGVSTIQTFGSTQRDLARVAVLLDALTLAPSATGAASLLRESQTSLERLGPMGNAPAILRTQVQRLQDAFAPYLLPARAVPLALERERTWQRMPYAELFLQGQPISWLAFPEEGFPVRLVEVKPDPIPYLELRTLLFAGLIVAWALLNMFTGRLTRPEQVALVGCLGAVWVGFPWGILFLTLPAIAIVARLGWAIWKVSALLLRRP